MFDIEPNIATAQVRAIKILESTMGAAVNYWLADKGVPASIGDIEISGIAWLRRRGAWSWPSLARFRIPAHSC